MLDIAKKAMARERAGSSVGSSCPGYERNEVNEISGAERAGRFDRPPAAAPMTPKEAGQMGLSEFARAGLLLAVRLPLLGETVWLASDNAKIEADARGHLKGCVVYRAHEWAHLVECVARGMDLRDLRLIHEAKKVFGGELLPEDEAAQTRGGCTRP